MPPSSNDLYSDQHILGSNNCQIHVLNKVLGDRIFVPDTLKEFYRIQHRNTNLEGWLWAFLSSAYRLTLLATAVLHISQKVRKNPAKFAIHRAMNIKKPNTQPQDISPPASSFSLHPSTLPRHPSLAIL